MTFATSRPPPRTGIQTSETGRTRHDGLSPASDAAVSLNFATANGSAKSGEDYDAKSGSLAFAAGQTSKTIAVAVKGDRKIEWQEVFYVNLSGAAGAFITGGQGTGVIRNDDR